MVCHDLDWMDKDIRKDWKGLASVIMVHRHTLFGAGQIRSDTSYYMSSLQDVRAAELLGYIRGHWSIENRCHWVLDAHNQMPFEGKKRKSLPKRELRTACDESYLEQLISLM